MEFNVPAYLTNDKSVKEIRDYNKHLSTGIVLDEGILYLLIVGDFVNKNPEKSSYLLIQEIKFGLDDFRYLTQFLRGINTSFFITPHIFTKFIHLLWDNINSEKDYEEIISIFKGTSKFIKEKHLDKNYFFDEDNFKKKKWDLINSSLILTSREHNHKTILTCRLKTKNICNSCGCLVVYYNDIRSAYITNLYN